MTWRGEWIVMLAQTGLLAILNVRFPETLGGGLGFVGLIPVAAYLARVYRDLAEDLGRLAAGALCLEVLNVVAFFEHRGTLPRPLILAAYLLTAVVWSVVTYRLHVSPIRVRRAAPGAWDPARAALVKRMITVLIVVPTQALVVFGFSGGLVLWVGQPSWVVDRGWLSIAGLILTSQILGAVAQKTFMNKFTGEQMALALTISPRLPIPAGERKAGAGLLVVFLLGTLAEVGRGLWLFWIGTYVLWVLTLVNSWQVWRHVFSGSQRPLPSADVPPGYNVLEDFRVLLYTILAGAVYVVSLAILLGLTSPGIPR